MKLIQSLILMAIFSVAVAGQAKSLEQYDASSSYFVQWPTVIFSNLSVPVKNVCQSGALLKTIAPVKYCSEPAVVEVCTTRNHGEEVCRAVRAGEQPVQAPGTRLVWGCAAYNSDQFETSKTYLAQVCTKWEKVRDEHRSSNTCVEFGQVSKEYAMSYKVTVIGQSGGRDGGRGEVDSLPFSIPQCQ